MFTEGLAGGSQAIVRPLWIGMPLRKPSVGCPFEDIQLP